MKFSATIPATTPRVALLLAATLAVISILVLLTNRKTYAQSQTAPSTPTLTAQATDTGIILRWEAVPDAARYELLTWWASDPGWQPVGGRLTGTTYTHTTVTAGTTYHYSIRALNAAGAASPWLSGPYPSATARAATAPGASTPKPTIAPTPTTTSTPGLEPTAVTTERSALIALYHATDGANWKNNDNWLSDAPLNTWYGITTNAARADSVTRLYLPLNNLSGPLPDLSALSQLRDLRLHGNELSGLIPDLNALGSLTSLNLSRNRLSGKIPDLSALDRLEWISLSHNDLTGPFPSLSASARMKQLDFSANQLSGPFPDLSAFTELSTLDLNDNRFSGPVFDLDRHYQLKRLYLHDNELSGPLPALSALPALAQLDLSGSNFCLPAGTSTALVHDDADAHLKGLDLQPCTAANLAGYPAEPANLSATVHGSLVTLSWDAVADAAGYELRVWDSLDRSWGSVGGVLTGTTYTHPVLTDGRNYYFQVRARDAAGVRGPWSNHTHAIIVPGDNPPPPASLGIHIFYQKYLEIHGVVVTAPTEVSDEAMAQAREVIAAMLSRRTALFENLSPKYLRVAIFKKNEAGEQIFQLPELGPGSRDAGGGAFTTATAWVAAVEEFDHDCRLLIHEFGHAIHFARKAQPGGQEFDARLHALYDAAMNAGLWQDSYASSSAWEYWAEAVVFWFWKYVESPANARGKKLEDYDPEIAKLVAETFGEEAYVPSYCKP